jgi:hypothetical protein
MEKSKTTMGATVPTLFLADHLQKTTNFILKCKILECGEICFEIQEFSRLTIGN